MTKRKPPRPKIPKTRDALSAIVRKGGPHVDKRDRLEKKDRAKDILRPSKDSLPDTD